MFVYAKVIGRVVLKEVYQQDIYVWYLCAYLCSAE